MMGKRDGIAALFDALIFLAIASLVSVALFSAFNAEDREPCGDERSRVEAAHQVLLRSTIEDNEGNALSLEELFKLSGPEGWVNKERIEKILDLLLPGLGWKWTVLSGENMIDYGSAPVPGPGEPLFCSLVRAPINGEEMVFRLEAWST